MLTHVRDALRQEDWSDAFVLASDLRGDRVRPWHRAGSEGPLIKLRRGVYLERDMWKAADADERLRWRIRAAAAESPRELVFSHLSAAVLWGLPIVGPRPAIPHVTERATTPQPSLGQLRRTTVRDDFESVELNGLRVTSLARTVVDVARTEPLSVSLPVVDAALAGAASRCASDRNVLLAVLERATARGRAMARTAVKLGDARAESPGESVSRAAMHVCGFPMPELQKVFVDGQGRMIVDFWWPDAGLVGEFDGVGKYLRHEYLGGMTPGEAVVAEKKREDRLRALGPRVTRWGWDTAWSIPIFRRHLIGAGLVSAR